MARCMICLDKILEDASRLEKCQHEFHYSCIMEHMEHTVNHEQKYSCPLCRTEYIKLPRPLSSLEKIPAEVSSKIVECGLLDEVFDLQLNLEGVFKIPFGMYDSEKPITSYEIIYNYKRKIFLALMDITSISKHYRLKYRPFFKRYYSTYYDNVASTSSESDVTRFFVPDYDWQHEVLRIFFTVEKKYVKKRMDLAREYDGSMSDSYQTWTDFCSLVSLGISESMLKHMASRIKIEIANGSWLKSSTEIFFDLLQSNCDHIRHFDRLLTSLNNLDHRFSCYYSDTIDKVRDIFIETVTECGYSYGYERGYDFHVSKCELISTYLSKSSPKSIIEDSIDKENRGKFVEYSDKHNLNGISFLIKFHKILDQLEDWKCRSKFLEFIIKHDLEFESVKQLGKLLAKPKSACVSAILDLLNECNDRDKLNFKDFWWLSHLSHMCTCCSNYSGIVAKIINVFRVADLSYIEVEDVMRKICIYSRSDIFDLLEMKLEQMNVDTEESCKRFVEYTHKLILFRDEINVTVAVFDNASLWSLFLVLGLLSIEKMRKMVDLLIKTRRFFVDPVLTMAKKYKFDEGELEKFLLDTKCLSDGTFVGLGKIIQKVNHSRSEFMEIVEILKRESLTDTDFLFSQLVLKKKYTFEQIAKLKTVLSTLKSNENKMVVLRYSHEEMLSMDQIENLVSTINQTDIDAETLDNITDHNEQYESYERVLMLLNKVALYKPEHQYGVSYVLTNFGGLIFSLESDFNTVTNDLRGRLYHIVAGRECVLYETITRLFMMLANIPASASDSFLDYLEEIPSLDSDETMEEIEEVFDGLKMSFLT